jgi:2-methylcitrate dehydratase
MENVLFKVSYPAEFHAQTAVEAAIKLHSEVKDRIDQIDRIMIETTEPGVRIITKSGPLHNPADRDHCIQYMAAIGLLFGELNADHYEDNVAADPRIDAIREQMQVVANPSFSRDYLDPEKRSIANSIQVFFHDGSSTDRAEVHYPLGHRRRRDESYPAIDAKFRHNAGTRLSTEQVDRLCDVFGDSAKLDSMPVDQFVDRMVGT